MVRKKKPKIGSMEEAPHAMGLPGGPWWGQGKSGHLLPFIFPFSYASALLSPFHALLTLPLELPVGPLKSS